MSVLAVAAVHPLAGFPCQFCSTAARDGTYLVNNVILTGRLICHSDEQSTIVAAFLPQHLELTLAESGGISFEIGPRINPWIWNVAEFFQHARSFELHHTRVKASEWERATADITGSYSVSGP